MEKNKMDPGGKQNTRLEYMHHLVHISNVVLSDHIKYIKNEDEKSREDFSQPIYSSLPPPLLQKINIRDFDDYIRYITKINTLSDLNIRNVEEISLDYFERILNTPPLVEQVDKPFHVEQHIEHGYQERDTQFSIFSQSGVHSHDHSDNLSTSSKAQLQWEYKHNSFLQEDTWCDMPTLTRQQIKLNETLDHIDRDINNLIRKEFRNYVNIITIMKKLEGEIKNVQDEIKTLSTHVNDVKEMLLKIIHLKKYNDLKRKCKKVNQVLKKFLRFQRLIKMLKKFLQKRKFYHCLFIVNKIFKIYIFFKKKKKKFLYFQQYFCNFNISYLKSFISQNFLFLFFFHSLLFLFRSRRMGKSSLCSAHSVIKRRGCLRFRSSYIGMTVHTRTDYTTTTQEENPFRDNPTELSKQNPHLLNFSSKGRAKINIFVKFHRRLNEKFMRNFHRKKKKIVKYRKNKEEHFFMKRWQQGVRFHFFKKNKNRGTYDHHLVRLNNLFIPALFFNNFFDSLRTFCSRESYLKHFVDDLFYGVLQETLSALRSDQIYDIGEISLFCAEEVASQSEKEEESSCPHKADLELDLKLKRAKEDKQEEKNQSLTAECINYGECYPSGTIALTCEHLVIEKCRKKKYILRFDQDGWSKLYRHIGLLPVSNLIHLMRTFFAKIKIIHRRINKWASFLMGRIIFSFLDDTFAENFAKHIPYLIPHLTPVDSVPFCKGNRSFHMMKHAYFKFWKSYRDIHHVLFKLLLARISDMLNVRKKCSIHLGINQVISLYWTIFPMLSFVRRKGKNLQKKYSLSFVRNMHRVVKSAQVSRIEHLCGEVQEGRKQLRVRRRLKRNQFNIPKEMKTLNCNLGRSLSGIIKVGNVLPVCLPPRKEAKCCEEKAHERSNIVEKSKDALPQWSDKFGANNEEPHTLDHTGEYNPRYSHPRRSLPRYANVRICSQNFYIPSRVRIAILRRGKREQIKLGRFLQHVITKTPHGKKGKCRLTHEERKLCRQIKRSIRTEFLVAINNFYEFKKIQMEKSLEIEKWNILEDIPKEINAQMEKYFKIKNEHTNKLCINHELFYLTNSTVSFLCIIFQYIHFMLSLPHVSFEIVSKILTFYDKQFLKVVHHFIMEGHAVTNCTLKSITIKILSLVIHTLDFADCTLRRVYAIWRHLLCTRRGEEPPGGVGNQMINQIGNQMINQIGNQMINQIGNEISNQMNNQMEDEILPNSITSRKEDTPNAQINVTQFSDHPKDRYTGKEPHPRDVQLEKAKTNLRGNAQQRYSPGHKKEDQNGSTLPHADKCKKRERTTISKKTNYGRTNQMSSLGKNEKRTHDDILQGMDTNWVDSVLVDFTKSFKYPIRGNPNGVLRGILRGICASKQEEEKVKANFKHMLDKSFLLKKKLSEKIVDILSTRFDYYTNIWLVSDSLLENHLVNSLSYECDILPYGMQLRSTFKLLTTYLHDEHTRNIYRQLFQDIANRFSLRINVLRGNDKYKKIISRLLDNSAPVKSKIDQLIMHYHNYELKEKTAHNIHKNVGDKILIDITNVLIILYKVPLLSDIIETFLNDFLKICKSHWYVTIDPFVILSKYKK
ncbi:conserved Plasmodium protein, unknown function [Plasmodium knowlesi strain H]|uniref:Vacuolar protein sorting-associated protein 54 C-terminal domain-containing protein n=3 Tax=Plasmodium knowlesi TaxID=5850 RepID=A0A5K1UGL0_PLAKH|nr:conserved Plasmodium protein, unknown function [Plasmodium knowlesi strain H]OTN63888.1 Uncharacterized protein PKNOH_S140284600 [Plasmodium knowlesi]CAA9991256.1 conserved Plasmodium protein, unknown function [Plasmodium knowlesi strain H]SBO26337.1 conserved Plasmodium protein, unknown function [Plasmodium knowlesi strain H]SBO29037.1 conserved Plasmodium protein, unknown function [Plasmodium knowlesi strain H]VVS80730.1 conserved Plasmodium protein, unknown function [Plasmodium knowlesi |eukprot:XP_002262535.1 hypothetical protein, conserved in Plasmodium species [Plasmodium knowlesi strain H]